MKLVKFLIILGLMFAFPPLVVIVFLLALFDVEL
nr:MAG TPA: hypothetical protein [Caudoviricetes sp.]